jgi:hypothetical protein
VTLVNINLTFLHQIYWVAEKVEFRVEENSSSQNYWLVLLVKQVKKTQRELLLEVLATFFGLGVYS